MKNFELVLTLRKCSNPHGLVIILLWFSVHVSLYVFNGPRLALSDVKLYLKAADFLLKHGHWEGPHQFFYITHISVISFFRLIAPHSTLPIVIFQSILS